VLVVWLIDPSTADPDEPDYGVSVLFAGVLGALATSGGWRIAVLVGALSIVGFVIGLEDASVLANAEHLLGFAIGAGLNLALDRRRPRPRPQGRVAI
jgi:hydrogenase/urease accessory protein HupE